MVFNFKEVFLSLGFPGGASGKNLPSNAGDTRDTGSIPRSGRFLEEGMATHSSILVWRILMDKGSRWATVHGLAKDWTWLSNWTCTHKPIYISDCSLQVSSIHGMLQARILKWVAISFSRGSSWPRNQIHISCIAGIFFTVWAIREVHTHTHTNTHTHNILICIEVHALSVLWFCSSIFCCLFLLFAPSELCVSIYCLFFLMYLYDHSHFFLIYFNWRLITIL